MAVSRSQVERRVFACVAAHEVGVGAQQHADHLQAAIHGGEVQRGLPSAVPHAGVRQLL